VNQPGIISDLPCCRCDTKVDAACCSHLTPVGAGHYDQIHRPGFPCQQQPGGISRATGDAECPRQVIAASGRDHAEYAITTRPRRSHAAGDCARHAVPANCHHQVTPHRRLGSDGARVPQTLAVMNQVAGASCIQYGPDRRPMPERPSTTGGRVNHDGKRSDHRNLHA